MNAINNFINVNIGNSENGNESLPIYGIYWNCYNKLCVFEIDDITNPYKEIDMLINGNEPEFKNVIFDGIYNDNTTEYFDNNTNISLRSPYINILNIDENGLRDNLDIIIYDDGDEALTNICETLSINKGLIIGCELMDGYFVNFMFIVSPGSLISDTYDGFGVQRSQVVSNG